MSGRQLVFIHGRSQEFQDPNELRREWLGGLNAGLTAAGFPVVTDEASIRFPYYANELYRITAETAAGTITLESLPGDPDEPGPLHPELPAEVGLVEQQMLADMARAAGLPVPAPEGNEEGLDAILGWGPARRALQLLARHTRADQAIISSFLKDVAVYLTAARESVLSIVRKDIPPAGDLVLVTHSLGTVVGRDLLDDADIRGRTALWVCAGSPLGIEAVQRNLRTPGPVNPGVPWITAYDVNDIVALGHPLKPSWHDPLTDIEVENGAEPHSITGYLGHREVAGPIGDALAG